MRPRAGARELAHSEDAGVRKTAVHALGSFPGEESRTTLVRALGDPIGDVRWNAAVALARRRDPAAAPVLLEMLDRAHLGAISGMTEEQRVDALLQAVAAAAVVPDARLRASLESLRDRDASLKVREARAQLSKDGRRCGHRRLIGCLPAGILSLRLPRSLPPRFRRGAAGSARIVTRSAA